VISVILKSFRINESSPHSYYNRDNCFERSKAVVQFPLHKSRPINSHWAKLICPVGGRVTRFKIPSAAVTVTASPPKNSLNSARPTRSTYTDLCTGVLLVRNRQISLLSRLGNKRGNDPRLPCLSLDNVIYRHEISKHSDIIFHINELEIIFLDSDLSLIFMYLIW